MDSGDINYFGSQNSTFGDRLAAARDAAGMPTRTLAKRLGVKHTTLLAWEEDASEPRANRLSMLAGILNVSLMWLLTGEGEGVAEPGEGSPSEIPADMDALLAEIRILKVELTQRTERLGVIEKKLRNALHA